MENSSKFFENRSCQFFPCHKLDGDFNCLFCYCPFYARNPCPGNPTFIKKEDGRIIKRCTDCNFPHKPENYEKIMSLLKTPKIEALKEEYHHGGENSAQVKGKNKIDFSVNVNPLGLPKGVKSAVKKSLDLCEKYPDQSCTRLREKLAKKIQTDFNLSSLKSKNLVCTNGASELISLLVTAICPKNALLVSPTFSGYERALKTNGCRLHYHVLSREKSFAFDENLLSSIKKCENLDMIFLCSPNNPTGLMIEKTLLEKIIALCEERGIFLFVDECFIDFTDKTSWSALQFVEKSPHLIVLNAFTKIYAMAGLRLGYGISSNLGLIQKINSLKPEWSVSQLSQLAGEVALKEKGYIEKTRVLIKREREYLSKELKALGFTVFPSEANFILFSAENIIKEKQKTEFEKLGEFLLEKGLSLRNCGNFKNLSENDWRIAVKRHSENKKLIKFLCHFANSILK